ncbi:MAG: signal peptidase I [Ilumatobacteraceae bacterium]
MSDTDQAESFAIEADGDNEPGGSTSLAALGRGAKAFFDWALVVVIALVVALGVRTFLLAHFVVEGSSMYSTLETGDRVFVNKVSYRLHDPNRGDVVVLHEIRGTTERDLIKRVIAVGGEEVEMRSCEVRIGGQLLIEPYLDPTVVTPGNCGGDFGPILVPEGTVFVMGDNRAGSQDSRTLGPVLLDDIVGRAFVVFWPRSNWQWL